MALSEPARALAALAGRHPRSVSGPLAVLVGGVGVAVPWLVGGLRGENHVGAARAMWKIDPYRARKAGTWQGPGSADASGVR